MIWYMNGKLTKYGSIILYINKLVIPLTRLLMRKSNLTGLLPQSIGYYYILKVEDVFRYCRYTRN